MLPEDHVWLGETVEQVVVDHPLRSRPQLLGWLEQRDEGPVPGVRRPRQQLRRARQPGDVHVVSAGVHDRNRVPVGVGAGGGAGVREAGVLLDREGVHVGAQHDGGAVAVAEHPDDAGTADARAHLAAGPLELLGGLRRRALLLVRELGVGMKVAVQVFQGFDDRVEPVEDRVCGWSVSRGGHRVSFSSFGFGFGSGVGTRTVASIIRPRARGGWSWRPRGPRRPGPRGRCGWPRG